jgi:hypothetical protein
MAKEVAVIEREDLPTPRDKVGGLMRPVAPVGEVIKAQEETRALIEKALKPGRDFGVIKGTDRATLLKPGGERILAAYGCYPRFTIVEKEIDHDRPIEWHKEKWMNVAGGRREKQPVSGTAYGLYRYVMRCEAVHRETDLIVGMGHGACSTIEPKYIENPRAAENTVLKMAEKRAMIDCVLTTFGLSDQFTQDMEESVENDAGTAWATEAQIEFIRNLIKSSKFSADDRRNTEALIERGLSVGAAAKIIERAKLKVEAKEEPEPESERADYDDSDFGDPEA